MHRCPQTYLSLILVSRAFSSPLDRPPDLRITPILLLQSPIQGLITLIWLNLHGHEVDSTAALDKLAH